MAVIRDLREGDLDSARQINRAAFAAFFGLPDPAKFRPGADAIGPRRRLWPEAALAIEIEGALAGAALMSRWGSVCLLGPLVVAPEFWSRGLARLTMERLCAIADKGGFAFTGLFTHPQSPKHIRLYESFGFRMQRIVAIMAKAPRAGAAEYRLFSAMDGNGQRRALAAARAAAESAFPGLDLGAEIRSVAEQGLGDTVFLPEDGGFALCHRGTGSEASDGQVLVKFAAVRGGTGADTRFRTLLAAAEDFAVRCGAAQIVAGTNTGRAEAYALMQAAGFRTTMNGIGMLRPAGDAYNRPGIFVIDDWR